MTVSFIIQQLQQYLAEHDDIEFDVAICSEREDGETVFGTKFIALQHHDDPQGNWVTLVTE